jgi:hypothetical protein
LGVTAVVSVAVAIIVATAVIVVVIHLLAGDHVLTTIFRIAIEPAFKRSA